MSPFMELLTAVKSSPEQISKQYKRYMFRNGAARYHFSLAFPEGWGTIALAPPQEDGPLMELGLVRCASGLEAETGVYAATLSREVHPADWQSLWLAANGYEVTAGRTLPSAFGAVGDRLATRTVNGVPYVYRSLATKDGDRVFLVLARCAARDYESAAEPFLLALQTFELLHATKAHYAEPMHEYRMEHPFPGAFLLPESWEYRPDPDPVAGGHSFSAVYRTGETVTGQFTFAAVPKTVEASAQGLANTYIGELRNGGLSIQPAPLAPAALPNLEQADVPGERAGVKVLARCAVASHPSAWLLFAMLGPAAEVAPEEEAANRRAWEIALQSFQTV